MKMKDNLTATSQSKGIVFVVILTAMLVAVCGCSKSAPSCDNGKTTTAVIDAVGQDLKKDLSAIAGMGGPSMELSDDEWKTIRAGMVIDLENIRENNFDEAAGKRTCAANLMITQAGKKELIPITYISEINKDTGELKVTLSGLKEHKQSPKAPALPE